MSMTCKWSVIQNELEKIEFKGFVIMGVTQKVGLLMIPNGTFVGLIFLSGSSTFLDL